MRAIHEAQGTRRASAGAAAAAVAFVAVLGACGPGGIGGSKAAPVTRLILRVQATDAPVTGTVDVTCESPITTAAHATVGASVLQRFETRATPGHDWIGSLDVAAGSTCTAVDRPAPPAILHAVSGGEPVIEDGHLAGVRTTVDGGATVTVGLVAGAAA